MVLCRNWRFPKSWGYPQHPFWMELSILNQPAIGCHWIPHRQLRPGTLQCSNADDLRWCGLSLQQGRCFPSTFGPTKQRLGRIRWRIWGSPAAVENIISFRNKSVGLRWAEVKPGYPQNLNGLYTVSEITKITKTLTKIYQNAKTLTLSGHQK